MRTEARLPTDLFRRPEMRALAGPSRFLYCAIRTTPTLSRAGVTTLLPDLWVEWTGYAPADIDAGLAELHETGAVTVDDITCEVFVPGAIVHEQVCQQPTILERAYRDAEAVHSARLQALIAEVFAASGRPRALAAAAALLARVDLGPNPDLAQRSPGVTPEQLKRARREFLDCAGRRRLRAEFALGLHVCPCGAVDRLTVDHVVPLARGGTNDPTNLQVLCLSCNTRKGARV
jgi:hypothetical protein